MASHLGMGYSKNATVAFRKAPLICIDLCKFIDSKRQGPAEDTLKKLADLHFTQTFVEVTIQIATFVAEDSEHAPSPDNVGPPARIYWALTPIFSRLSALCGRANKDALSAALHQEIMVLQNAIYNLMKIWLDDKGLYDGSCTTFGPYLQEVYSNIHTILDNALMYVRHPRCKALPTSTPKFLTDSLSLLLRIRFFFSDASAGNVPPGLIQGGNIVLSNYSKTLIEFPDIHKVLKLFDLSKWTARTHKYIVSHFLSGATTTKLEVTTRRYPPELLMLAQFAVIDQTHDMLEALIELDYLTVSISCAKQTFSGLQGTAEMAENYEILTGSWYSILLNSESGPVLYRLAESILELNIIFLLEKYLRASTDDTMEMGKLPFPCPFRIPVVSDIVPSSSELHVRPTHHGYSRSFGYALPRIVVPEMCFTNCYD
ncbi:hypothetical protein DL93DRAFT_2174085 [Clavulina sp. PMI_390]|nr:hypothetical protein DL93DRAFT_2174085 [Clavulina sp. PMI_390]